MPDTETLRPLALSFWPSLRRALGGIVGLVGLPLFVLAATSALKLLSGGGVVTPSGWITVLLDWQAAALDWVVTQAAQWTEWRIPQAWLDIALIWLFFGNATARAEREELAQGASGLTLGERLGELWSGLRHLRLDTLLNALPTPVLAVLLRVGWPLIALHRLAQPWVVEGPGPTGDTISSSVWRKDLGEFHEMVSNAGVWDQQTVYDHRQVLLWQVLFGLGTSFGINALSAALA